MLSESKDSFTSFSVFIPSVLFLASWHWLLPPVCIEQKWWGWTWLSCSQYFLILFIFSCRFRLHLRLLCFSSVQLLSCVWFFVTPWTAARQTSLSITHSWSLLKLMSIESVMSSNHLILCCLLLLLPSIFPSIKVFSSELVLYTRWPNYWKLQLQHQSFQWIFRIDFH